MFSFILGLGYNILLSSLLGTLSVSVTESLFLGLTLTLGVGLLFVVPTSIRIQRPDHSFDWLKYF